MALKRQGIKIAKELHERVKKLLKRHRKLKFPLTYEAFWTIAISALCDKFDNDLDKEEKIKDENN